LSACTHGKLRKSTEFEVVFAKGKSVAGRALVLYQLPAAKNQVRVGFCVGKALGKAVKRNRIKRLLRESWRRLAVDAESPADLVFVARSGGVQFSLDEWCGAMRGLLTRAGIIVGRSSSG